MRNRKKQPPRQLFFLFALFLLLCSPSRATEESYAQATLSRKSVFLGEVFMLDILVKSDVKPVWEGPKSIPGFHLVPLQMGDSTGNSGTFFFRFSLRSTRPGKLSIPPFHFLAGTQTLSTQPLSIQARKPESSDRMSLELSLPTNTVYLGEPLLLTVTWDTTYPLNILKSVDLSLPLFDDSRFRVLSPFEPGKEKEKGTTGLPVHGERVLATRHIIKTGTNQPPRYALSFQKILIPRKTGDLHIPPAYLLCAVKNDEKSGSRNAFQYPAYFDNAFFLQNISSRDYTPVYTESAPLLLHVKPLPAKGRPPFFTGLVGDYSIQVSAQPTELRVGDPLQLSITIHSSGRMEQIELPPLSLQPGLSEQFEISSEEPLPTLSPQAKTFLRTLRPRSTAVTNLPPLRLAFFNPASNAYEVVQSQPIPLKVLPAPEMTALGLHVKSGSASALSRHTLFFILGILLSALLVLFLLFALFFLFSRKKKQLQRWLRVHNAFRRFRRAARSLATPSAEKSIFYTRLDLLLRDYFGHRFELTPSALSFRDVEKILRVSQVPDELISSLRDLFLLCETYRFTAPVSDSLPAHETLRQTLQLLRSLEQHLKNPPKQESEDVGFDSPTWRLS